MSDIPFGKLVQEAWFEAKVNASAQGRATEPMLAAAHPPRAWVDEELGFGAGEGPSLQLTLLHLDKTNRRARKILGEESVLRVRETAKDRQQRLLKMAVEALAERKAGAHAT